MRVGMYIHLWYIHTFIHTNTLLLFYLDEESVGDGEELEVPLRGDHVPVVVQRRLFTYVFTYSFVYMYVGVCVFTCVNIVCVNRSNAALSLLVWTWVYACRQQTGWFVGRSVSRADSFSMHAHPTRNTHTQPTYIP